LSVSSGGRFPVRSQAERNCSAARLPLKIAVPNWTTSPAASGPASTSNLNPGKEFGTGPGMVDFGKFLPEDT
jgi:hypothetical protein